MSECKAAECFPVFNIVCDSNPIIHTLFNLYSLYKAIITKLSVHLHR